MDNTLFVLGAHDPEMAKIESILRLLGYQFVYALDGEKRSIVSSAYSSTHFNVFNLNIVYIECDSIYDNDKMVFLDHHKEGDYGYLLDYNDFIEASSLGQFFKYILIHDFYYVVSILNLKVDSFKRSYKEVMYFNNDNWYLDTKEGTVIIPEDIVLLSGIDHCLSDAYKGKCKGIDKDLLFEIRISQLSSNLNMNIEDIKELVNKYIKKLNYYCGAKDILNLLDYNVGEGFYSHEYLILREVAIYKDIPIAIKQKDNDLEKLMFLSLNKIQVEEILENEYFNNIKLKKVFGVPVRGYAGGFI